MRLTGDIQDKGPRYTIGGEHGRVIYKHTGKGKALTHLLRNQGKSISLAEITEASGWGETIREMENLTRDINSHSKDYRIKIGGENRNKTYELISRSECRKRRAQSKNP
jgi:hypothetical protein